MEQDQQDTGSLYNFLYIDYPRAKSVLAQLFNDGVLTTHTKTSQSSQMQGDQVSASSTMSGTANIAVAKGMLGEDYGIVNATQTSASSVHEKNYDAIWALPLNLLDSLSERNLINRDISAAKAGSFVIVSGKPRILDIKILQEIWTSATSFMLNQIKITHSNKGEIKRQEQNFNDMGGIMKVLPPSPQVYLSDAQGEKIWAALQQDYMVASPSFLTLTYGVSIPEDWYILGILDAKPDEFNKTEEDNDDVLSDLPELMGAALIVLNETRALLGRPKSFYGVTPILIFREIK